MTGAIHTERLQLTPVSTGDVDDVCALLGLPEVRRFLCDDERLPRTVVAGWITDSMDPSSVTR